MYKILKRTCEAIVSPIGSLIWPPSHRRLGLLKVPLPTSLETD